MRIGAMQNMRNGAKVRIVVLNKEKYRKIILQINFKQKRLKLGLTLVLDRVMSIMRLFRPDSPKFFLYYLNLMVLILIHICFIMSFKG